MEDNTLIKKEKKIYFRPLIYFAAAFLMEIVMEVLMTLILPESYLYKNLLVWFFGKAAPLIFLLIILRKDIKEKSMAVGHNFGRFVIYLIISFGALYLLESGVSYYSLLMDKYFQIGEASNQEAIYEYFKVSSSFFNYAFLFIVIVIFAPILEELEFRHLISEGFKGMHWTVGLAVGSVLFGLIHMTSLIDLKEWAYFPIYALPGLGLGIIYHYGGKNFYTDIMCHAGINLISFIQIIRLLNETVNEVTL